MTTQSLWKIFASFKKEFGVIITKKILLEHVLKRRIWNPVEHLRCSFFG